MILVSVAQMSVLQADTFSFFLFSPLIFGLSHMIIVVLQLLLKKIYGPLEL